MLFFLIGGLEAASWIEVSSAGVFTLIGLILLTSAGRSLNAASFGEEHAKALGIPIQGLRIIVVFASSMMIGSAVATAGMIGFVGLFVPHALRLTIGADHRILIPLSGIAGASFLMLADALARSQFAYVFLGGELPVGIITALIGAPMFFWLLKR